MEIAELVAEAQRERQRQLDAGETPTAVSSEALAKAAAAYAYAAGGDVRFHSDGGCSSPIQLAGPGGLWPFQPATFKPTPDRRRGLVAAAALIVAALERLGERDRP